MTSESYVVFIVRDNRKADLLFQASDMTWLSYNTTRAYNGPPGTSSTG